MQTFISRKACKPECSPATIYATGSFIHLYSCSHTRVERLIWGTPGMSSGEQLRFLLSSACRLVPVTFLFSVLTPSCWLFDCVSWHHQNNNQLLWCNQSKENFLPPSWIIREVIKLMPSDEHVFISILWTWCRLKEFHIGIIRYTHTPFIPQQCLNYIGSAWGCGAVDTSPCACRDCRS